MNKIESKFARRTISTFNLRLNALASALIISAMPSVAQAGGGGTFATIDFPGADSTQVWGIQSVGGDLVGLYTDGRGTHGFRMSSDGGFTPIDVPFEGATFTWARGISRAGDIVGRTVFMGVEHGWLLSGGVFQQVDFPGASATIVLGMNDVGSIGGGYVGADGKTHAFVRNGAFFTAWDFPDAIYTNVRNINNAGDVVGRRDTADQALHGYLLRDGEFVPIDIPDARITITGAINSAGDIVGRYVSPDGAEHGFLLRAGNFTIIDVPGAVLTDATGIDDAGTIVGYYQDADGQMHGYRLTGGTSLGRKPQ